MLKWNLPTITMKAAATILLHAAIIGHASADCLVGDIMYQEGDSTGHIGLECINTTSYDGNATVCGPDGQMITSTLQFTCPQNSVPNCVQCGPRGWGAALCLSTTDRPGCTIVPDIIKPNSEELYLPKDPVTIPDTLFDQCESEEDVELWRSYSGEASRPDQSLFCSTLYIGRCQLDSGCVAECFQETYGYSEPCSVCFGMIPNCSFEQGCTSKCMSDPEGSECQECNQPCISELNECTGLPQIDSATTTTTTDATTTTDFWSPSCSDGRPGIDDASCTLSLREDACENNNLSESECAALGCCQWNDSRCSAACVIPADGDACCNIATTTPTFWVDPTTTTTDPFWSTPCSDGREGIDDPECTLLKRKDMCDNNNLGESECVSLGCCQWDAVFETCSAACVIPDNGDACCILKDDSVPTPSPESFIVDDDTPKPSPQPMVASATPKPSSTTGNSSTTPPSASPITNTTMPPSASPVVPAPQPDNARSPPGNDGNAMICSTGLMATLVLVAMLAEWL